MFYILKDKTDDVLSFCILASKPYYDVALSRCRPAQLSLAQLFTHKNIVKRAGFDKIYPSASILYQ